MQIIRFIILSISLLIANTSYAQNTYIVSYVYDGDTVKLRLLNAKGSQDEFKLRLTDIDAPERNQAYGLKSRRALIELCQGRHILVTAHITGTDKYNRSLGSLQCNDTDASQYLVTRGLAWQYTQYSSNPLLHSLELNARQKKLGLWASKKPVSPWVWRHKKSHA